MAEGVTFDLRSAERIAATVKAHERRPGDATGQAARGRPDARETLTARLTVKAADGWEWEEVQREDGDPPTWEAVAGGRTGDDSKPDAEKRLAVEATPGAGRPNAVVTLRRCSTRKEDGTWVAGWLILPPAGTFPVTLTKDGGAAGGGTNNDNCTQTYSLRPIGAAADSDPLATEKTPDCGRLPKCEYTEGTVGLAYVDGNDEVQLYSANERPVPTEVSVTTGAIEFRLFDGRFEYRTPYPRTVGVLWKSQPAGNDNDKPWTLIVNTTTECPDEGGPP